MISSVKWNSSLRDCILNNLIIKVILKADNFLNELVLVSKGPILELFPLLSVCLAV